MCSPCYVNYSFIGRFENLEEDTKHVLDRLTVSDGPGANVTFAMSNAFNRAVPLSQERTKFYADVSQDVVRKLIRLYKTDYEMFDYDYRWACADC